MWYSPNGVISVKKRPEGSDVPKKRISDNVKAGLMRWWIMGMCYYLVAMGLQTGMSDSPLDLILLLGIGTGLATVVVYDPIAYSVFNIKRGGRKPEPPVQGHHGVEKSPGKSG